MELQFVTEEDSESQSCNDDQQNTWEYLSSDSEEYMSSQIETSSTALEIPKDSINIFIKGDFSFIIVKTNEVYYDMYKSSLSNITVLIFELSLKIVFV